MDSTELLLEELTEVHGVPGYEADVRALMRRHLEPLPADGDQAVDVVGHAAGDVEAGPAEGVVFQFAAVAGADHRQAQPAWYSAMNPSDE